jgi:tRNA(fMet)-specific endonuclease VapC
MRYLLDSDWIINYLAGNTDAKETLLRIDPDDIGISLVTVAEVYESAYNFANPEAHLEKFRDFHNSFHLLDLNLPIIETFAEVRAHLRRRGELIADFDILLGATALHYDLTLLTYNTRHFARIPHLKMYPQS